MRTFDNYIDEVMRERLEEARRRLTKRALKQGYCPPYAQKGLWFWAL